ncbi:MAG: DUF3108 domain-containing protein [Proteobacteria bacterium]|nr:DUF3108 domain-containing protein [Pseudomonadota bacterium]
MPGICRTELHRAVRSRGPAAACATVFAALTLHAVPSPAPADVAPAAAVSAAALRPFEASYSWQWHGLTVALSSLRLRRDGDTWTYDSRSEPRGIGVVFSERPVQHSVLRVTPAGVQPLSYSASDGTRSTRRSVEVRYDRERGRVTGVYEDTPVDLPLTADIQDDASVQVALMVDLLAGRDHVTFGLLDRNSVREYRFTREGEQALSTALGPVSTVVYRAQKQGSPRVTRFWCDPARGYVPLKVEQTRGDDVQWTMLIASFSRGA